MGVMKVQLRERAIALRRSGQSYREIMREVPVAKSTISLWLRSVGLTERQKQRLTEKKLASIRRGSQRWHAMRLERVEKIWSDARVDIDKLKARDLWLAGIMLYWAEGSKEKQYRPGQQAQLSNSDPRMINLFLKWLRSIIGVSEEDIILDMYIHVTANASAARTWWAHVLACEESRIRVYFKRQASKKIYRRNTDTDYHGLMRVRVSKSSALNRKISAWTEHICRYWGVV